jgi:hypothetical protein
MTNKNLTNSIKIPHLVIIKAPGLLPMQYKAREIAEELNIPESTLRDWLSRGAPHFRDPYNHIWIQGKEFSTWIEEQRQARMRRSSRKLKDQEGYCLRCNRIVLMINPLVHPIKGKMVLTKGQCPTCGCTINRGGRHDQPTELPQG